MNLDDMTIYVFVRQDLPDWQQLVHSNHAAFNAGISVPDEGRVAGQEPNLILIGLPNEAALLRACEDFRQREVNFFAWRDPDAAQLGLLALATMPLDKRDKNKLHHYRPWTRSNNTFGKGCKP